MEGQDAETLRMFEGPVKACYNAVEHLSAMLEYSITAQGLTDRTAAAVLQDAAEQINNAAYRLDNALLDRLAALINARIGSTMRRLAGSLALAIAAAAAAFVIIIVTAVNIRKSTRAVHHVFKNLESNNLSVTVTALSRDELGALMAALGGFLEKLKAAFASFNQNAAMVSTAVYDLSASAKEITTTANEQSASVAEIVSTMENSKNLSEQVAAKTLEVANLAARTQELSLRGAELRDANQDMMLNIREQNAKIIDEINNLADMLSRIDESVQLIDTIADQTKLIAFNAALEASSSGEAGSRFAVVASEIRRFADNVVESVMEIKEKIMEVQAASQVLIAEANNGSRAIDSGYARMVEQKEVFENIVDVSQNVATRSQQISNLSKQQELASAQIFTALKEISAGVKQFVTATASTSATADNLNSMSIELKETLAKYQAKNQED
jgi:methyl-accepting chemotaxis protein